MYDPVRDGVDKRVRSVSYTEDAPPDALAELVHCFWELRTESDLVEDFELLALPDACVNLLFDQRDTRIAGVTALHTTHITLNLGCSFHYVGIQFFPGVWGDPDSSVDHYVGEPYGGDLPLVEVNRRMENAPLAEKELLLAELVERLREDGIVAPNPTTAAILNNLDEIHNVADMAGVAGLSARQLQRTLKRRTGFSPHDLLKVLRVQHSFRRDYVLSFADQSHFTHSFRNMTGHTPAKFNKTFDV